MKKIFKLMLAVFVLLSAVSCELLGGLGGIINGGNNGGGNEDNGDNGTVAQLSFVINVTNVTATGAVVSVNPSNNDTYYFDVCEKDYFNQYDDSQSFAADYIAELKSYLTQNGLTLADVLSSGSDSYEYSGYFNANTSYYVFAFGVNANGEITSKVATVEFTTLESAGGSTSNNIFDIAVSGVTSNSATVSVTPLNNDTYYFDVYEKDVVDQYGDINAFAADYIAYLKDYLAQNGYSIAEILSSGADSYTYNGDLTANTTYYAFAVGVNGDGIVTTAVTSTLFTTEASGSSDGGSTAGGLNITNLVQGACTNYGDYYEMGATNYWIDIYNATGSEVLILEVQSAAAATSCVGTYPFNLTFEAGSATSGFINDSSIYGSFWAAISESSGNITDYALITGGSVTISKSGNNYVITLNGTDNNGAAITASYYGELEEGVETYSKLSNGSNRKGIRLANLDSFKKLGGKSIMLKPVKGANAKSKVAAFTINKAFGK